MTRWSAQVVPSWQSNLMDCCSINPYSTTRTHSSPLSFGTVVSGRVLEPTARLLMASAAKGCVQILPGANGGPTEAPGALALAFLCGDGGGVCVCVCVCVCGRLSAALEEFLTLK